jgi:hypothetical protein
MIGAIEDAALVQRENGGALTWRGPLLMLVARSTFAVVAQAVVAVIFALRSSPAPWHEAEPGLPVYGTLIDAGCLTLLWRLTRREGIALRDLIGFDRTRLGRDLLLGLALIPAGLALIFGGTYTTGWLVYGRGTLVSIVWSFQHAVMPLTFDPKFMVVRALSPLPFSVFQTLLYLRFRRLIPFATAHALMDGASVAIGVLLPHLQA